MKSICGSGLMLAAVALCGCSTPQSAESPSPVVWSNPVKSAPKASLPAMNGPFTAGNVSVVLHDLPEHRWVRVRFDLLILQAWSGSNTVWGPDLWVMQVKGGPQLMRKTFTNCGVYYNNRAQSYPDDYPWGVNAGWTGAQSLDGKPFPKAGDTPRTPDAAYPIEVFFPHSGGDLSLDFSTICMANWKPWGVANFEYSTSTEPVAIDPTEMYRLWDEMASPDAVRANLAMWRLISGGPDSRKFIVARVDELLAPFPERPGEAPFKGRAGLRLWRAHRALHVLGGSNKTTWAIEHMLPEYFDPLLPPN